MSNARMNDIYSINCEEYIEFKKSSYINNTTLALSTYYANCGSNNNKIL